MSLNDFFIMQEAISSSAIEGIEVSKLDRQALLMMSLFPEPITFEEAKKFQIELNKKLEENKNV
jgi:hypothetical protein